ncbi:MAG: adenosine deaminase [Ignavibacteriaceae bacterium]
MKEKESTLKLLPKIELHLHLDCSLSFDVVHNLQPQMTEKIYSKNFIAPEKCNYLADFLKCAASGINLMQTEADLIAVVKDLFKQLRDENVIYAEIRFAPLQHLINGLSAERVVEIVCNATEDCINTFNIQAGLILCTLRHFNEAQSLQTVSLVERFIKNRCVVGFDIAADEAGFPIDEHKKAFKYAIRKDIPRTAHAGEAKGAESIWETINNFKPQRIGHGVRSIEDARLVDFLIENQIHLEVCPTCNIQTNIYQDYSDHPIDYLYKKGVSLGVNSDARSLVNITLTGEYLKLVDTFGWEIKDLYNCNINALSNAFITETSKQELKLKLNKDYAKYF